MGGQSERHFERFRRSGSPRALGRVYDALAPELLALARRLTGDPVLAEDVLHLTFITAIERAGSFRSGAPLMPWLVGILNQHAKAEKRRRARRPDPLRLAVTARSDPAGDAEGEELDALLVAALARLPEEQRSVLVLRLRHELTAAEIAAALGRPPGTVRSQLARGLDRLRAELPAGLLAGTSLALGIPLGLASIRASVVQHAAASAPSLLVAAQGIALASLASVSGGLVMKKLALATVAVVGSVFGIRAALDQEGARPEPTSPHAEAVRPASADAPADLVVEGAPTQAPTTATTPAAERTATPAASGSTPPVEPATGSFTLHVSDLHGAAVADEVCVVRRAKDWSLSNVSWSARTDASGVATLDALPVGTYRARLLRGQEASFQILPGEETVTALTLSAGVDVEGVVVDAAGDPVPNAEIWVSERWHARRGFVTSRADAAGRFTLRALHEDNYVAALAPGYGISYVQAPRVAERDGARMRIVLDSIGSRVELEVVDAEGRPVPRAAVLVGDEHDRAYRAFPDGSSAPPPPPRRGVTDDDGHLTLTAIPVGDAPVFVRAAGFGLTRTEVAVLPDRPTPVRVVLEREAVLAGFVSDESGEPVERALVLIGARGSFASSQAISDVTGRYVLGGLPAGTAHVAAERKGVGTALVEAEVSAGEAGTLDLVLIGRPRFTGTLRDADGLPVPSHTIVARLEDSRAQVGTAVSDRDGAFSLEVEDAEARYSLMVRRPGDWRSFPLLVRPGVRPSQSPLALRIPRSGLETASLRLLVTDPSGNPANGARLELWHAGVEVFRTFEASAPHAEFALDDLPPGALSLSLRHESHPMLALGEHPVRAGETLDLGTVAFAPSGSILGRLRGLEREAARAELEIRVGRVGGEYGVVERTEEGFRTSSLAPGDYLVSILGDHVRSIYETVSVTAGAPVEVELQLVRAGLCRITLSTRKGDEPPRWVGGQAKDAAGRVIWSGTAHALEDGSFEARVSAPLGRFTFEANDSVGRVARTQFDVVSLDVEAPAQRLVLTESP